MSSIFDEYLKALVDNTPIEKREQACLRMIVNRLMPKQQQPATTHERTVCLAWTLGGLVVQTGNEKYLLLSSWLAKASEQEINAIFEESESVN